jgi:hypothetical protein
MKGQDRKAAIAAYKECKQAVGVFAVRCATSGEVWVGKTSTLDAIQNRFWFTLRQGMHPNRELQRAWSAHGETSFAFEVLERLPDAETSYSRDILLDERFGHWRTQLNASAA